MKCDGCGGRVRVSENHVVVRGYVEGEALDSDLMCGECWGACILGFKKFGEYGAIGKGLAWVMGSVDGASLEFSEEEREALRVLDVTSREGVKALPSGEDEG